MQKGFIFDLDGTVYLGNEVIEGVPKAINKLKDQGHKILFLSNKPIATRKSYEEKLTKMGIEVTREEILNSNYILATYLQQSMKEGELTWVLGEPPLFEELENAGIKVTSDPLKASHIVLSWDRDFTYQKLNSAFQAWRNGAKKVIATNPDGTCPIEGGGQIPDCGAIIGAFEGATGTKVDLIAGKPSPITVEIALSKLKLPAENCYMVGDRLETDIKMGLEHRMKSVLVLSGITSHEMLKKSKYKPHYTLTSVKEIHTITT
ncbi:HAD-IIA family hydrolase [Evansella halocellulosilytica]|uniref:HAD-IIA family hydrolase n=1 Tax=Evansella halocellulosilytica TaxID=2011013 RepID=UPI000BB6E894|nr:HAD-IIA family hydrolase [Evansella halocellulosilytica]